jgi:hypothetical protein
MSRARARVAAAVAGVVAAGAIAAWWTLRDDEPRKAPRNAAQPPARKLDVSAFRADVEKRKAKVEALRAREEPKPAEPAKPYEPPQASTMIALLVDPECNIGPGELCKGLEDIIRACDVGDAAACLAVAQYLQDTPPRPPRGVLMFLLAACKRGEQSACERVEALKQPFTGTCADDPIACATHALRAQDRYLLGQACEAGVAETCAWLGKNVGNADARRRYLEASCQLGRAAACADLGKRLSPSCTGDDCYAPDAEQAAAALAIACAAGYTSACK